MSDPVGAVRSSPPRARGSVSVAVGILASRLSGLVRQRVFSHYMGAGIEADAFNQAVRIPNLLQNLFGEGALSASFIPVYARLRAAGDDEGRQQVAGAVLGILSLLVAVLSLVGVLAAPFLVDIIAPGFGGDKRELTVRLVRVLFPGTGLLVLSAWCLGVLNSHGRFLLSYASPVVWNLAMIGTLLVYGGHTELPRLAWLLAWASVAGSLAQLLLQWPVVHAVLGAWRVSLGAGVAQAAVVFRNFMPAFVGRGVTQLSAFLDSWVASFLMDGSVTILANAQVIYMLPVSLFGISISAAELPAMSGDMGVGAAASERQRQRLEGSLNRVVFLIVPSAIAFLVLGDVVGGLVYRSGRFGAAEGEWLWGTLAAMAVGLVAATLGRLYATTHFALQDTRTPQRFAIARVLVAGALGLTGAFWVGPALGLHQRWSVALLALGSAVGAWVEYFLLRGSLAKRLGNSSVRDGTWTRLLPSAMLAALVAYGTKRALGGANTVQEMLAVVAVFGGCYAGFTVALGVPEARAALRAVLRRV